MITIILKTSFAANGITTSLETSVDGMSGVSNIMRRKKRSATNTPFSCPKIIKLYNNGMGGVDIMDQKNSCLQSRF